MRRAARFLLVCCLTLPACLSQDAKPPDPPLFDVQPGEGQLYSFGITVVSTTGFRGDIYRLKPGTRTLPGFNRKKALGAVYTTSLNVPPRSFSAGFPGITDMFEWFAIDYHGRFWIENPGRYRFALGSDDGSKLYIDGKLVIDNDGQHAPKVETGGVVLKKGVHRIRVSYFQGPRHQVALVLSVTRPEDHGEWRVFNTDHFRPADLEAWSRSRQK